MLKRCLQVRPHGEGLFAIWDGETLRGVYDAVDAEEGRRHFQAQIDAGVEPDWFMPTRIIDHDRDREITELRALVMRRDAVAPEPATTSAFASQPEGKRKKLPREEIEIAIMIRDGGFENSLFSDARLAKKLDVPLSTLKRARANYAERLRQADLVQIGPDQPK
jgi:hypothetical protein